MKLNTFLKKHAKLVIISLSVILAVLLLITFLLPVVVRPIAEKNISAALNRTATIRAIKINPFTLSVQIDTFRISELNSKGLFIGFDRLYVDLQIMSVIKKGLIVRELHIDNPQVNVIRLDDSTYSFSDLMKSTQSGNDSSNFHYSLSNIKITGGLIRFSDMPKNISHEVKDLSVNLPFLSNIDYYANIFLTPSFSAIINGTPFALQGKTRPFDKTMETEIALRIDKMDLAEYVPYIPQELNFSINRALFSTDGYFTFMLKENKRPFFDYSGTITLDSIEITDRHDSLLLNIPSLKVDAKSADIVSLSINLRSISIMHPALVVRRENDGSFSLSKLLPPQDTLSPVPEKTDNVNSALKFHLDNFELKRGNVHFTDYGIDTPLVHLIELNSITANNLDLDKGCSFNFEISGNGFRNIATQGTFSFDPPGANGTLGIDSLDMPYLAHYLPGFIDLDLKKGVLKVQTAYDFKTVKDSISLVISDGSLDLHDLKIHQKSSGDEIFRNQMVALRGLKYSLLENILSIDTVQTGNATITIKRFPNGAINLASLVSKPSGKTDEIISDDTLEHASVTPFSFLFKCLKMNNYNLSFEDQTTADSMVLGLKRLNLNALSLSNKSNRNAALNLSADLYPSGHIKTIGNVSLQPLAGNFKLDVVTASMKPVQSYLGSLLNIDLTGGNLSLSGKLGFAQVSGKPLEADYEGNIKINDFQTITKENADNFLSLKELALQGVHFVLNPLKIDINEADVTELYSLFNIYADGSINLQTVLKKDTTLQASGVTDTNVYGPGTEIVSSDTTKKNEPADIAIGKVMLNNCTINFSDYRFKNIFSTTMKNLDGKITGLSSHQDVMADVLIKGNYDATSPISISGKINPLSNNLFIDLGLNFKDIDITKMSPYSQKYLGYTIRKGKLSLDLTYLVKDSKLNSSNNLFLDQLTLGEAVESPDAVNLPVKFALALLKDNNGDISLDIPITGSLDDPKFNIGKLLLQVLGNIITKTVTSPFAALGSIFGGSEELSYLEFEPGSSDITVTSMEKLDKISDGLARKDEIYT